MTRRFGIAKLSSVCLLLVLFCSIAFPYLDTLDDVSVDVLPAQGRQDGLDVDCSGYTFEDLFEYDFALFQLNILDDWATGDLFANAWVNGSNAAIVRDNLDGLFAGLPGGDNNWISTDERDAVRSIGPKCIADMETRLGMREGVPHSGGVDWNDFEFVEDGIGLDEVNLVPLNHQDTRTCTNFGAAQGCKEVPTSTTDDLEIRLELASGETNNIRWDQLPNSGVSNFTLAMNITNMSNAALRVNFPILQGLRMYDFRVVDNEPESGQSCDDIGEPSFTYLGDGSLQVTQLVNFDRNQWDLVCHMFIDFTTQIPESNEAPIWNSLAPSNGSKIPTLGTGTWRFATAALGNGWASDDDGWALHCDFEQAGWSVMTDVLGDFYVTQPVSSSQSMATCLAVDPLGKTDENDTRTWQFGTLFSATGEVDESGKNAVLSISSAGLVDEFLFAVRASQLGVLGPAGQQVAITSAQAETVVVSLDNLRPGAFMLSSTAQAQMMLEITSLFDLGLVKPNSPPTISVATNFNDKNATWDENQLKFSMYGLVSDPDLEGVTMSLTICGADYQGFSINGINWEVEISTAICLANGLSNYDVLLKATDDSGATTSLLVHIEPPSSPDDNIRSPMPPASEDSALPAMSLISSLCILGFAAMLRGGRDD